MSEPTIELAYIQSALEELGAYLLSKELFWPVSTYPSKGKVSKLTPGNLLLSLTKLKAYLNERLLSPDQKTAYAQCRREIDAVRHKWSVAWESKVAHEFQSRLRQWTHYLNELDKNLEAHAPFYSSEVRSRVLLELLRISSGENLGPDLADLDTVLQVKLSPADFVWDSSLVSGFPQETYWFLYAAVNIPD